MKIIVAIKQVPARDSQFKLNSTAKWIDDADLTFEINVPDAYALEEALQLKEKAGAGEVIALCLGPERAGSTIREALAKGADRAIHIVCEQPEALDPLAISKLLAAAVRTESPDLVVTGLQSDDLGSGQTGVILAELLGASHATIIMEVLPQVGSIRVKRELEDGWFQYINMPLPAVLTIQSGANRLRYATLMGIKKAKTKELRVIDAASLGTSPVAALLDRVYLPDRQKQTQMLTGSAKEQAAQLVEKLKFEMRVL